MNALKNWNTRKNREFVVLTVFFVLVINILQIGCLSRFVFHLPCPFCGMSRAWVSLLNLNISAAFTFHPLFWLAPLYVMVLADWINTKRSQNLLFILTIVFVIVFVYRTIFLYIP
ncbi:MAG: DUF2752 domain-containing protein [Erysipelothrix sp.]